MKTFEKLTRFLNHVQDSDNQESNSNFFSTSYNDKKFGIEIHVKNVLKNFKDFTKPYKNYFQPFYDAFLFGFPLTAIISSVYNFALAPLSLIAVLISPLRKNPKKFALDALKLAPMALLAGTVGILLACVQLVLSPLALLRIPVRLVITKFTNPYKLLMENNNGYKRLLDIYDATNDNTTHHRIAATLLIKSRQDLHRGQKSLATKAQVDKINNEYKRIFAENLRLPALCTKTDKAVIDHKAIVDDFRKLRNVAVLKVQVDTFSEDLRPLLDLHAQLKVDPPGKKRM